MLDATNCFDTGRLQTPAMLGRLQAAMLDASASSCAGRLLNHAGCFQPA
jgi:hypothetical protein